MTNKTDAHRLDHVIAAALLLQRSLRNPQGADIGVSTGDVQAHDTGLQRAAEARGHTTERCRRCERMSPRDTPKWREMIFRSPRS